MWLLLLDQAFIENPDLSDKVWIKWSLTQRETQPVAEPARAPTPAGARPAGMSRQDMT
jgi:hypothetical protein